MEPIIFSGYTLFFYSIENGLKDKRIFFFSKKIDTPLFVLIKNLFMIIRINEQKKIS